MFTNVSPLRASIAAGAAALLGACSQQQAQQAAPPPTLVDVVTVSNETLPNIVELPGRIQAVRTAEVRARTNGIVLRRLFREGSDVTAGTPLFEIDPREYRAKVKQAAAALDRAIAARSNAASVVQRYRPLVSDRSVSGQENDAAIADLRQADAQVAEARAELEQAKLQLSFTTVRAPISGRVDRAEVTEGALVSGNDATLMTRINQLTPVYAVFTQSNSAVLNALQQVRAGDLKVGSLESVKVRITLDNGGDYGPVGHLDFTEQSVDPQTGSQIVRAIFPNPGKVLAPGQFVRARVIAGRLAGGVAVPARAVQLQGSQASVSVVNQDGTVASRPVQLGAQIGSRWAIASGLSAGDRVVVDGWQKVRPGQKVRMKPAAALNDDASNTAAGK